MEYPILWQFHPMLNEETMFMDSFMLPTLFCVKKVFGRETIFGCKSAWVAYHASSQSWRRRMSKPLRTRMMTIPIQRDWECGSDSSNSKVVWLITTLEWQGEGTYSGFMYASHYNDNRKLLVISQEVRVDAIDTIQKVKAGSLWLQAHRPGTTGWEEDSPPSIAKFWPLT
jgi:hypothetical protein